MLTEANRELYPARNQNTIEMTVSNDENIALSNSLFEVASMIFLHQVNDRVDPPGHLIGALASRAACSPDRPISILLFDLFRVESFIVSVVPFADFFGKSMRRWARDIGKEELCVSRAQ